MTEPEEVKECALCGKGLAIVGLLIAGLFLYVSFDVLMDGKVTSMITRNGGTDA